MSTWNTRYAAFASATGMTPGERLAKDKTRRTGRMADFILWIGERWLEWGGPRPTSRSTDDHKNFDAWLVVKYMQRTQMELELT